MKAPRLTPIASALMLALATAAVTPAVADDAPIFRRNVSKTPDKETEYANVKMMYFYVPAQNSAGDLVYDLPYIDPATLPDVYDSAIDPTTLYLYRDEAKPLLSVYTDGYVAGVDGTAFAGHGQRDAFVAISLDDGNTWKKTNLSKSASRSSFEIALPVTLWDGTVTTDYPGDVTAVYSAIAANKILVAWQSRYCASGYPAYLLAPTDGTAVTINNGVEDIVYQDLFDVRGGQHSVDYATADFIMDDADRLVGEVPFNCLWTARGQMYTLDGKTSVLWTVPERLTSGKRDVNRIEVTANKGGFAVTWQEDPEGLLPGAGEGSGEGWSGAVTNPETDIWYSYVTYANFGYIDTNTTDGLPIPEPLDLANLPTRAPRAGVLFSVPVRLTDNAKCAPVDDDPYCYADLDGDGDTMDLCNSTIWVEQLNTVGELVEVCVAEDGRPMLGQASASRARLQSAVAVTLDGSDFSDWIAVDYEERKALGEIDENLDGIEDEIGKNARHQTFELRSPSVVRQGFQINQPSTYWNEDWAADLLVGTNSTITPEGFRIFDTANTFGWELYDSEIARRTSTMVNITPLTQVKSTNFRLSMVALYKEGLINQGGPADIMARRWQVGSRFDPQKNNPYDPGFMNCRWPDGSDGWIYDPKDGVIDNIHYLEGLCGAPAYNLSATIPEVCEDASGNTVDCLYGAADAFDQVAFPKTLVWDQTETELRVNSWENPYDVAKGHRGYLDGDFVMVLYAWSPNWKQLADGQDHYNLYVRRSFNGLSSWTATPNLIYGGDGTTTCENYLDGTYECTDYAPSDFEKARNVSQLMVLKDTVLDPRYTPTASPTTGSWDPSFNLVGLDLVDDVAYEDDVRERSKFFAAFESGDASYIGTEGEPHPWDMFDSRAYNWGDDYYLVSATENAIAFFDGLETRELQYSGEAALTTNPAGIYLYAIWNQWEYDTGLPAADSEVINSDATFRKVLFFYPTLFEDPRTGTGTNPIGPGTE